ncbi:hypothetical protein FRB98_002227 [Tulasnella sp. 332]|nr:hypothetical protein FRB98_002227 [Tulasnella sp. 332]
MHYQYSVFLVLAYLIITIIHTENTASAPQPISASADGIIYAEPLSYRPRANAKRRGSIKRGGALLALLDELQALKDDSGDDLAEEVPLANLGAFMRSIRPLGSSIGLIASVCQLRIRLHQILHLFCENASEMFPEKVKRQSLDMILPLSLRRASKGGQTSRRSSTQTLRPIEKDLTSDLGSLPMQLRFLAKDLVLLLHLLHDIPEFADEALNPSVLGFEADLMYRASCLQEFEKQFHDPSTKRYVNDLNKGLKDHLEDIRDALKTFEKEGVAGIRAAQSDTQSDTQRRINNMSSVITATICTGLTYMALLIVALGFASDEWVSLETRDSINDARADFLQAVGLSWAGKTGKDVAGRWVKQLVRAKTQAYEMSAKVADKLSSMVLGPFVSGSSYDGEESLASREIETVLPMVNPSTSHEGGGSKPPESNVTSSHSRLVSTPSAPTIFQGWELASSPTPEINPMINVSSSSHQSPLSDSHTTPESPSTSPIALPSAAKTTFQQMVRQIVRSPAMINIEPSSLSSVSQQLPHQRTGLNVLETMDDQEWLDRRPARIAFFIPVLRQFRASQYLDWHQALVRHLQFSLDGKWLATCSWDRTAVIWRVGDPFTLHKVLGHGSFGFVGSVAWSPTGTYLLTKLLRGVKIWTVETGVCRRTTNREQDVQAVAWLPCGATFACVEFGHVHIMSLEGDVLHSHRFERMEIHGVAFTLDEKIMLLSGTLQYSIEELKPGKFRAEKRIMVYDLHENMIENQVPVLERVRAITISGDGQHALVSFEDTAPPELWRLVTIQNQMEGTEKLEVRLTLYNTYIPAETVHFAGASCFGGASDQFVVCAGKEGDIHIWDRESGLLLHTLQAVNLTPSDDGDGLAGIAWNQKSPGQVMFASGTHDGAVRIWTAPLPSETQPPSRAESPDPTTGRRRGVATQPVTAPAL